MSGRWHLILHGEVQSKVETYVELIHNDRIPIAALGNDVKLEVGVIVGSELNTRVQYQTVGIALERHFHPGEARWRLAQRELGDANLHLVIHFQETSVH
jgi:hypothetical protein